MENEERTKQNKTKQKIQKIVGRVFGYYRFINVGNENLKMNIRFGIYKGKREI